MTAYWQKGFHKIGLIEIGDIVKCSYYNHACLWKVLDFKKEKLKKDTTVGNEMFLAGAEVIVSYKLQKVCSLDSRLKLSDKEENKWSNAIHVSLVKIETIEKWLESFSSKIKEQLEVAKKIEDNKSQLSFSFEKL